MISVFSYLFMIGYIKDAKAIIGGDSNIAEVDNFIDNPKQDFLLKSIVCF